MRAISKQNKGGDGSVCKVLAAKPDAESNFQDIHMCVADGAHVEAKRQLVAVRLLDVATSACVH